MRGRRPNRRRIRHAEPRVIGPSIDAHDEPTAPRPDRGLDLNPASGAMLRKCFERTECRRTEQTAPDPRTAALRPEAHSARTASKEMR